MSRVLGSTALRSVRTDEAVVVVTFDDGPDDPDTPTLLSVLAARRIHATFFVLGTRVRRFPALLQEVVAEGHEVGVHGMDHRRASDFTGPEHIERMTRTCAEVEDRIGRAVRFVRPPYGEQTIGYRSALARLRLTPVLWGPTTRDAQHVDDRARVHAATTGVRRGSILLAHDAFAGPDDGAADGSRPTVDRRRLMEGVLGRYGELGLRGCSLSEALAGARGAT